MVLSESASTARPLAERTDAELQAELARASKIVATVQAEIEQRKADRLQLQAERREVEAERREVEVRSRRLAEREAELDKRAAKHRRQAEHWRSQSYRRRRAGGMHWPRSCSGSGKNLAEVFPDRIRWGRPARGTASRR